MRRIVVVVVVTSISGRGVSLLLLFELIQNKHVFTGGIVLCFDSRHVVLYIRSGIRVFMYNYFVSEIGIIRFAQKNSAYVVGNGLALFDRGQ